MNASPDPIIALNEHPPKRHARHISLDTVARIRALADSGVTKSAIAARVGIALATVCNIVNRKGPWTDR